MHPFFFPLPPTFITSFWLRDSVCSDTHYCLISHVRYDLIYNAQKRTRNRPESLVVLYFFSSIFSLLPYPSCVTNLLYFMSFICYPPFNLLITEGRHTMQNSILFSSSILNRQPQPNKKKETWKPHLLHKALQMQCLLAMLQLFCASAHASLELTRFKAEIPLPATFTFCKAVYTLRWTQGIQFWCRFKQRLHIH